MAEKHPFKPFVPPNTRYLLLGSFVAKKRSDDVGYDWYYGSRRNQFWAIMELVYHAQLSSKNDKQALLARLSMAMADIILGCERKGDSSLDANLINLVYNTAAIRRILENNLVKRIIFTSRFVENEFCKHFTDLMQKFPEVDLVCFPSPSPRYAVMSLKEKAKRYKTILPSLK